MRPRHRKSASKSKGVEGPAGEFMNVDGYRLLSPLGAGRDGASHRAIAPDGMTRVELRDLAPARADPTRWASLSRRISIAARFDHPGAVRVVEPVAVKGDPVLVVEWLDAPSLAEALNGSLPVNPSEALTLTYGLAGTLAEAHRIGLTHGRIAPGFVRSPPRGRLKLDFTGTETITAASLSAPFLAPECDNGADPGREADIYGLGALLVWLLTGSGARDRLDAAMESLPGKPSELLQAMLATSPDDRPTAREVKDTLGVWISHSAETGSGVGASAEPDFDIGSRISLTSSGQSLATVSGPAVPVKAVGGSAVGLTLGRFRLLEVLGSGGQGVVYRAEDTADGSIVALKVLRPEWASHPTASRRFRKEARLLAEVNNPYVVTLLEHNEDGQLAYLVMEFVTGRTLSSLLTGDERLDESTALSVAADVARALEDAHTRGIIHRDIKPSNVLLLDPPLGSRQGTPPRAKLTDFGLARHVVDPESLAMTATGAVLGTPQYMAPEQSAGRQVDARADIYALGATLYHMLVGRPPFLPGDRGNAELSDDRKGSSSSSSSSRSRKSGLSDGVRRVLERSLAKAPDDRYPDAAALLKDLERLARGEPTGIPVHPVLPPCDPKKTLEFEFRWNLEATPRQLWPYVTNTDRLDRALGFPPVRYAYQADPNVGVRLFAEGTKAGMAEAWEEHPYEWVEPRRMGVLREYTRGPFVWLVSTVELTPRTDGGTTLTHRLRLEPRGWKSRTFTPLGVGVRFKASLGRIYERIDATLTGKLGSTSTVDPFEPPEALTPAVRARLDQRLDALAVRGVDPTAVEWLGELLARAPVQEIARLRPLALAQRWGLEPEGVVAACLHAAREGLLVLLWDILCPACRIPCEVTDTLRAIRDHGRCESCQLDFELDFAGSVELIFRAHPEIRPADTGVYCAGGPAHAPHVLAQVRVLPGERFDLELTLPEGEYLFRGPQLPWSVRFVVRAGVASRRVDVDLMAGPTPGRSWTLGPGGQVLALWNPGEHEILARVEREASRDDALTAAGALVFAPFRDLFPGEVLSPGQLVGVASVTLLVTHLDGVSHLYDDLGDARAFELIHDHFRVLDASIRGGGGTVVKTIDEGVIASFSGPEAAVKVGLELASALASHESMRGQNLGQLLRLGVHRGSAMVATIDGRLDYFGGAVRRARRLPFHSRSGDLVVTPEIASDPLVSSLFSRLTAPPEPFDSGPDGPLYRLNSLLLS